MTKKLTEPPGTAPGTFLDFPLATNLDSLEADIAILGVPFGVPYESSAMANDQSRASEMPWIDKIVQIGMRGIGSARTGEVDDAMAYGAKIIDAYEMHDIGMDAVLDRIPDGGPYYLTIDADGIDPTIMPAVMAQTPGGLSWVQIRKLIHGLVNKGRVLGMDLVEIAPMHDVGNISLIHAERLICNFIGASVRARYYG